MTNTVIAIKKSAVPSAVPGALANGELALNFADGKLFYKRANGTISAITSGSPSFGTVNSNNTLLVAGVVNDILDIRTGTNIEIASDYLNNILTITANLKPAYDTANAAFAKANTGGGGGGGGGASVTVSTTPPALPSDGNLWWNTDSGRLFIYYTDVDSGQWVEATASGGTVNISSVVANVSPALIDTFNAAYKTANAGYTTANAAFAKANAALANVTNTVFDGNLTITGVLTVGTSTVTINNNSVSASYFYGDATGLTNVPGSASSNSWANTVGTSGNSYSEQIGTAGNNYTNSVATAGNNYMLSVATAGNNYVSVLATNNAVGANAWSNTIATAGNNYTNSVGTAGNNYTNSVGTAGNNYTNSVGLAGNNYASVLTSIANTWANTVGTAGNNYASILAANNAIGANAWANAVGTAGNNYTNSLGSSVNSYMLSVTTAGNNYASVLVANNSLAANSYAGYMANSANAYGDATFATQISLSSGLSSTNSNIQFGLASANSYAGYMANSANASANSFFVRLNAPGTTQTITSDIAITGNLTISGNTTSISANNLSVVDPLIYLASDNADDLLDIGFLGSYYNTTSHHVHTGLYRDHASKQYYLFQGYAGQPESVNDIVPYSNNMTISILNADIIAGNITLGSTNVYPWIVSAYNTANAAYGNANSISVSANSYAGYMANSSNNYAGYMSNSSNNYAGYMSNSVNTYTTATYSTQASLSSGLIGSNAWANTVATAGNNYASILVANNAVGANTWANTKLSNTSGVSFAGSLYYPTGCVAIGIASTNYPLTIASGAVTPLTGLGGALLTAEGSINSTNQFNIRNAGAGAAASSDLIATADDGTDTTNFIDLGINNSGYNQPAFWTINGPRDGYLYMADGNLSIGVANSTSTIKYMNFFIGGGLSTDEVMRIQDSAVGANIGIGTTTPGYKVDVVGTMNAANILVNQVPVLKNTTGTLVGSLTTTGTVTSNGYLYITPTDGQQEGGEIQLQGAGSNTSWSTDAYQNNYRIFARTGATVANVNMFHSQVGGFVRLGVNRQDPIYTVDVAGTVNTATVLINGSNISPIAANAAIEFIIDGGGTAIAPGQKGHLEIPFNATINQWTLVADQSGSANVEVWSDTYANFPPTGADTVNTGGFTLVSAQKNQGSLFNTKTTISAGDILAYNVASAATVTRLTLSLKVTKT